MPPKKQPPKPKAAAKPKKPKAAVKPRQQQKGGDLAYRQAVAAAYAAHNVRMGNPAASRSASVYSDPQLRADLQAADAAHTGRVNAIWGPGGTMAGGGLPARMLPPSDPIARRIYGGQTQQGGDLATMMAARNAYAQHMQRGGSIINTVMSLQPSRFADTFGRLTTDFGRLLG